VQGNIPEGQYFRKVRFLRSLLQKGIKILQSMNEHQEKNDMKDNTMAFSKILCLVGVQ